MESFSSSAVIDRDHHSIVDYKPDKSTYVAEPAWIGERAVFLNDLSFEERELIEELVSSPIDRVAPIDTYSSVEEFVADERPVGDGVGTLNFMGFFQPQDRVSATGKREMNAYRRLKIVDAELVEYLETALADTDRKETISDLDPVEQEKLFQAYNLMASLTSIDDPGVCQWLSDHSYLFDPYILKH